MCQRNSPTEWRRFFRWVYWAIVGRKKYYEKFVRLPFEDTTMPVPADYHRILSGKYHDYFKIHKVWSGHDYPYFEGQRKNLQAVADFKLPEFTFDKAMLRQNTKEMKIPIPCRTLPQKHCLILKNCIKRL